jgi:hypothetical protein
MAWIKLFATPLSGQAVLPVPVDFGRVDRSRNHLGRGAEVRCPNRRSPLCTGRERADTMF